MRGHKCDEAPDGADPPSASRRRDGDGRSGRAAVPVLAFAFPHATLGRVAAVVTEALALASATLFDTALFDTALFAAALFAAAFFNAAFLGSAFFSAAFL